MSLLFFLQLEIWNWNITEEKKYDTKTFLVQKFVQIFFLKTSFSKIWTSTLIVKTRQSRSSSKPKNRIQSRIFFAFAKILVFVRKKSFDVNWNRDILVPGTAARKSATTEATFEILSCL